MESAQIRAEVERLQSLIADWESQLAPARQELEYWKGILKLREGTPNGHPTLIYTLPLPGVSHAAETPIEDGQAEGYGAKSRALRLFVRSRASEGVTLQELTAEAKRLGSHPNMAYRFADRLTKATPPQLERRGDRIFPTDAMTLE